MRRGRRRHGAALDRHRAWLRRRGIRSPDRPDSGRWRREYSSTLRTAPHEERPLSGGADATADRSLMSRLHLEPPHVREEILRKASRVAPVFNKGGLQYVTEGTHRGFDGAEGDIDDQS